MEPWIPLSAAIAGIVFFLVRSRIPPYIPGERVVVCVDKLGRYSVEDAWLAMTGSIKGRLIIVTNVYGVDFAVPVEFVILADQVAGDLVPSSADDGSG